MLSIRLIPNRASGSFALLTHNKYAYYRVFVDPTSILLQRVDTKFVDDVRSVTDVNDEGFLMELPYKDMISVDSSLSDESDVRGYPKFDVIRNDNGVCIEIETTCNVFMFDCAQNQVDLSMMSKDFVEDDTLPAHFEPLFSETRGKIWKY